MDGTMTDTLSVRTLPALTLMLALSDWMAVPEPLLIPASELSGPSLEPRSKPARLVLLIRTGPLMIGFAAVPVTLRLVVRVPPCRREPLGRWTPTEGKNASSASMDVPSLETLRLSAVVAPLVW